MLDRAKVLQQLHAVADALFIDTSEERSIAYQSWQRICADPLFQTKILSLTTDVLIPSWSGPVDAIFSLQQPAIPYAVLAVDGSQIYPDRHQGTQCFLINIGSVLLHYGPSSRVICSSQPFVYNAFAKEGAVDPIEMVDGQRQGLELRIGLEKACAFRQEHPATPFLFLFDGSLIFWHLASKEAAVKEHFLQEYMSVLQGLYEQRIPYAGYISLPKNKELVNLIRVELCNFILEGCTKAKKVDHIVDTTVAQFFLPEITRSIPFKSNAVIGATYPAHSAPYFLYINGGDEIGRLEIPAWVAHDTQVLEFVVSSVYDQIRKGYGYPVALAESHEQAVVKGPDRDFFYHLVTKIALSYQHRLSLSLKNQKKRRMGV